MVAYVPLTPLSSMLVVMRTKRTAFVWLILALCILLYSMLFSVLTVWAQLTLKKSFVMKSLWSHSYLIAHTDPTNFPQGKQRLTRLESLFYQCKRLFVYFLWLWNNLFYTALCSYNKVPSKWYPIAQQCRACPRYPGVVGVWGLCQATPHLQKVNVWTSVFSREGSTRGAGNHYWRGDVFSGFCSHQFSRLN